MKLSEAANEVIRLANAIRAFWEVELPKRFRDYPVMHDGEEEGPPPAEAAELRDFLTSLPPEMLCQLVLLMYLGRGDFSPSKLGDSYEYVKDAFSEPSWAVSEMMDTAPLAEHLADGLAELKKHKIDVNKLPLKRQKAIK
jgi:hypothetical protein